MTVSAHFWNNSSSSSKFLLFSRFYLPPSEKLHPQQSKHHDEEEEEEQQTDDGLHGAHEGNNQVPERGPVPDREKSHISFFQICSSSR